MSCAGAVSAASERESFTQELKVRITIPDQLVPRGRIVLAAEIAPHLRYQAHRISKEKRRLEGFFLA